MSLHDSHNALLVPFSSRGQLSRLPEEIVYDIYHDGEVYYGNSRKEGDAIEQAIVVMGASDHPDSKTAQELRNLWYRIRDTSEDGLWMLPTPRRSRQASRILFDRMFGVTLELSTHRQHGVHRGPCALELEIQWDPLGNCWLARWSYGEFDRSRTAKHARTTARKRAGLQEKARRIAEAQKSLDDAVAQRKVIHDNHRHPSDSGSDLIHIGEMDKMIETLEVAVKTQKNADVPIVPLIVKELDFLDVEDLPYCRIPESAANLLNGTLSDCESRLNLDILDDIQALWDACVMGHWDLNEGVFVVKPSTTG